MDNFPIHRNKDVRELIEGAGRFLAYLPTYSPDSSCPLGINPIELVFSKIKAFLRKARATQVDALIDALSQAIATVLPQKVKACFNHCGYL